MDSLYAFTAGLFCGAFMATLAIGLCRMAGTEMSDTADLAEQAEKLALEE